MMTVEPLVWYDRDEIDRLREEVRRVKLTARCALAFGLLASLVAAYLLGLVVGGWI